MTASMRDAEVRMGLEPIDDLLHERAELIDQVATLRAKYGSFGVGDHIRKIELSRLKGAIRAQAHRDKRKLNNEQVDEEAHAHPDYHDLITQMTLDRAELVRLESHIEAIEFKINRGQMVGRYLTSELHLQPTGAA